MPGSLFNSSSTAAPGLVLKAFALYSKVSFLNINGTNSASIITSPSESFCVINFKIPVSSPERVGMFIVL